MLRCACCFRTHLIEQEWWYDKGCGRPGYNRVVQSGQRADGSTAASSSCVYTLSAAPQNPPARLRAALSSQADVIRTFPDVIQRPSEQCSQHQRPTQMYLPRKTTAAWWKKLFQPLCFSRAGLGDSFFPRCALVKVHRTCKSGRMKGLSHNWIHSMQHLNTSAKGQTLQIHRCCSHSATFTYKSASIIYVWNPLS